MSSYICGDHARHKPRFKKTEILDNLFLGTRFDAENLDDPEKWVVVNVCLYPTKGNEQFAAYEHVKNYVTQKHVDDHPNEDIWPHFASTTFVIKEGLRRGYKVLVHCMAGVSRSAAILIAYMVKERSYTVDEALSFLQEKRPIVNPNDGFIKQLKRYFM